MPGRISQPATEPPLAALLTNIPKIFDQVQISTANHQKNFVALYKLHVKAAQHTEIVRNGNGMKLVGERTFEETLQRLLLLALPQKKGASPADRVVKFIGGYTKFVNEKAAQEKNVQETLDYDDDTTEGRFTAHLLRFLLKGFLAKDKTVRYRVLQIVAEMVSHLGEIDEDIYKALRAGLIDRVSDKETSVRVQAVIALAKLCGTEDPSEVPEGETVLDVLVDSLAHDSSPDVRRAVLVNLPVTPTTIPHILARTRDTDTATRRAVYNPVLQENTTQDEEGSAKIIGPTHPRALTITQRELIVRNGLGDREASIRAAAASLIANWVEVVDIKMEPIDDAKPGGEEVDKVEKGALALTRLFDLTEGTIASDALLSVFTTRVDIFNNIEFGDQYWLNLTPESAFLARVFVDHCIATKDDIRLEAALPVVTALAFRIQETYNGLLDDIQNVQEEELLGSLNENEKVRREDARMDTEFVIGEMLKLAVNLDYSDEIGRRKMFQLVRDMLSASALPASIVPYCLDVLRKLSANERDLIRVVVEIVNDLRDTDAEEEDVANPPEDNVDAETSFDGTPQPVRPTKLPFFQRPIEELSLEELARRNETDLKCLTLCIGMLERVNGTFEENSTLDGILGDLIIPSVKRKDFIFREKGLICLGLCCLIARRLASKSLQLFLGQIQSAPEGLKERLIQTVFDMLMVHETGFYKDDVDVPRITSFLTDLIGKETEPKVQALLCMGLAKLVLSGMLTTTSVVQNLIMAYLSPHTVDNQELRQCLTFFLHVYSYSSTENQKRMREIFLPTFSELNSVRSDLEEDQEMVSAAQVGAMFVDWTDPLKLTATADARTQGDKSERLVNDSIHLEMACDIIKALLDTEKWNFSKEERKILIQLLSKLHIPHTVDDDQIRTLKLLLHALRTRRPPRDFASMKAFTKFETTISEKFAKQLEDFSEEEYKKLEELQELFEFLDSIIPDDDDETIDIDIPKKKGRKRRSGSITSTTTDDLDSPPASKRGKSRPKSKRPRLSNSDDDESTQQGTPPPPVPTRSLPKRAAAVKKPAQVIIIDSDDDEEEEEEVDEEEEEEVEDTPGPRSRKGKRSTSRSKATIKREANDESDSDGLPEEDESLSANLSKDSIMDPDSEEEEDEVNDLLADA